MSKTKKKIKDKVTSITEVAVKNPKKTVYLIGGIFSFIVAYKIYIKIFPPETAQESASTNFNNSLISQATISDVNARSAVDLFMNYINTATFGTNAKEIIELITRLGLPNFVKVIKLFGKKYYDNSLGYVYAENEFGGSFFGTKRDLITILKLEFSNESRTLQSQLNQFILTIENY